MKQIEAMLDKQQLSMGDVVMMHVYLVGDPNKGGQMDFAGNDGRLHAVLWHSGAAQQTCTLGDAGCGAGRSRRPGRD